MEGHLERGALLPGNGEQPMDRRNSLHLRRGCFRQKKKCLDIFALDILDKIVVCQYLCWRSCPQGNRSTFFL